MNAGESIRSRALRGEVCLGLSVLMPWQFIPELAKAVGYDYIRLDLEHSYLSESEVRSLLQAARLCGIPAQVRVPDLGGITPLLGQEPAGIMVPHVSSAAEAQVAIDLCRFSPAGQRGMDGGTRLMRCEGLSRQVFMAYATDSQSLIVQIESREGIDRIDEILSLEGIDMVATGRADLSQALGVPGSKNDLAVLEAEEYIIRKAIEHGKIPTIAVDSRERFQQLYDLGVRCFQIGKDERLLIKALKKNRTDYEIT